MSRLRIAHVLLTPRFAGSERQAIELANRQVLDHEVAMVLSDRAAEERADAWAGRLDPRIEQLRIGRLKPLWSWQVRRALVRWQPTVAHAHLSHACKALAGWRTRALRVATLHIHYKAQQHARLDALIAIAPWQLEALPPAQRARCAVIPNASAPPAAASDARQRLRRLHGVAEDEFLIGTLGRAEQSKGWDLLVQAFAQAAVPKARLALVGSGPQWKAWRAMAPETVLMPGFSAAPQDWLAAFDLFVSAARSEPFGLVFLEALHAGLPVLATASEGAKFLAPLLESPLLALDSVAALRDALVQVSARRPARRCSDLREFDPDLQAARVESFYREQLNLQR